MVDLSKAFIQAEPRPQANDDRELKKNYAERLSRSLAQAFSDALRTDFPGIIPDASGTGHESPALGVRGTKKLDVNYSTSELGLGLGVSIKTINFRDPRTKRYTKNYSRNDNELRAEALDYHLRQPYAVLAAVVFLPVDAADDAKREPSSFGQAVQYFRLRAGREKPSDPPELFEGVFIGLYDHDELRKGGSGFEACSFFDVRNAPPRARRPTASEAFGADRLIKQITGLFLARNNPPIEWLD